MTKQFLLCFLLAGCGTATTTGDTQTQQKAIVGSWLSDGGNVAPLLAGAPFNWKTITASFDPSGSYTVLGTDKDGKQTTFSGTWSATQSDVNGIWDIVVNQSAPSTTTAEGIYQVDGGTMKYEVVQTQPTNGLQPPTAAQGFGSTVYNGQKITSLIQTFVRQ
jgi:hypothetical protein